MTKYQLEIENEFDFFVIGLACHVKDYRLCWALNTALNTSLSKENGNDEQLLNMNLSSAHALFSYYDEASHITYHLVSNRSAEGYLIAEAKGADFFLIVKTDWPEEVPEILERVRAIDLVLMAYEIDVKNLKARENLLF